MRSAQRIDGRQVRRNFTCRAGEYERYAVVQKRVVDRLLGLLLEEGPVSGPILEVGAGTGWLSMRLARAFPEVRPVVSDIAHDMTCRAASQVPKAMALDADAQALPLRSASFPLVLSSSAYQWVNSLFLAFSESARVLTPEGRFVFALFGKRTLFELRESHRGAVARSGESYKSHVQDFPGEAEVHQALMAAGFKQIRVFSEDEVEYHGDVATVLRSLKGIGAQNASTARPAGLASRRIMNRMMTIYEERYGKDGVIPATYHVIYGLACKRF